MQWRSQDSNVRGRLAQVSQHERSMDLEHRRNHKRKTLKVIFFVHVFNVTARQFY